MIFGESVLGKLAMTFLMAMVPVVELRGPFRWGWAAGLAACRGRRHGDGREI